MPDFVHPPKITDYLLETCEDACQVIVTFADMSLALNQALSDLYTWFTSSSFPNMLYDSATGKFYYYENGAFHEFTNFPNVFVEDNKLKYKTSVGVVDVPAYSIKNNVFYDPNQTEYLRLADGTSTGKAFYPYQYCVKYSPTSKAWQVHDGSAWQDFEPRPIHGTLMLQGQTLKTYQSGLLITANLPYREGDLRAENGFIVQYKNGLWSKFFFEGQIQGRIVGSSKILEIYKNGKWEHYHTLT